MNTSEFDDYHIPNQSNNGSSYDLMYMKHSNNNMFPNIKFDLSNIHFTRDSEKKCMYIGCLEKKYYKNLKKRFKNDKKKMAKLSQKRKLKYGKKTQQTNIKNPRESRKKRNMKK